MAADLVSLETLLDLLRRKGVQVYECDGTKILLGPEPHTSAAVAGMRVQAFATARQQATIPPDASLSVQAAREAEMVGRELTDEEILFASSRGWPSEGAEAKQ